MKRYLHTILLLLVGAGLLASCTSRPRRSTGSNRLAELGIVKKTSARNGGSTTGGGTVNNGGTTTGGGTTGGGGEQTWREDLGYGLFAINRGNPNGMYTQTTYGLCASCRGSLQCAKCYGTGRCALCSGQGGIVSAGFGTYIPCPDCSCTGICSLCKGTGQCYCTTMGQPGYTVVRVTTIYKNSFVYDSGNLRGGSGGGSSTDERRSTGGTGGSVGCSYCHGTGVNPSPISGTGSGMPEFLAYTNGEGQNCPYCSWTNLHQHERCAHCNVPGR